MTISQPSTHAFSAIQMPCPRLIAGKISSFSFGCSAVWLPTISTWDVEWYHGDPWCTAEMRRIWEDIHGHSQPYQPCIYIYMYIQIISNLKLWMPRDADADARLLRTHTTVLRSRWERDRGGVGSYGILLACHRGMWRERCSKLFQTMNHTEDQENRIHSNIFEPTICHIRTQSHCMSLHPGLCPGPHPVGRPEISASGPSIRTRPGQAHWLLRLAICNLLGDVKKMKYGWCNVMHGHVHWLQWTGLISKGGYSS